MTEGFDILNKAINDFVIQSGLPGIENFNLMTKLTDIILNNRESYFNYKYNKKYSLKESDRIVKEFLDYLNPYYREYYEKRL